MSIDKFSNEVCGKIGYYVYGLIDPRNGRVFYVGKGKNNRLFEHIKEAIKIKNNEDAKSEKITQIRAIKKDGFEVIHVIYRHGMTEKEAKLVESVLIDYIPGLSNSVKSGGSNDYGIRNAESIQKEYSAKIFQDRDDISYMLIKIRQSTVEDNNGNIYEAVRFSWIVSKEKVDKIDYVLAVVDGIVQKVYKVDKWKKVENSKRYEFIGEEVTGDIAKYFINKRIPEEYRKQGNSNPILYPKHIK